MSFRILQTAYPLIRGTAVVMALCAAPALFGQSPTTLETHTGQSEIRYTYSKSILAGTSVTEGGLTTSVLVIDNISLEVGGSGAQTNLVEFISERAL
jgi:hypothetical protein